MNTNTSATTAPAVINLEKDQRIDLSKTDNLTQLAIGCGWDEAVASGVQFDVDASLIALVNGKFNGDGNYMLYFSSNSSNNPANANEKQIFDGACLHSGDNRTGAGAGDDETLTVHLDRVPANVSDLMVVVNIYKAKERKQNFGSINSAHIRLYNKENSEEIARRDLTEDYSTANALVIGRLYRKDATWRFQAIDKAMNGTLSDICNSFNAENASAGAVQA